MFPSQPAVRPLTGGALVVDESDCNYAVSDGVGFAASETTGRYGLAAGHDGAAPQTAGGYHVGWGERRRWVRAPDVPRRPLTR